MKWNFDGQILIQGIAEPLVPLYLKAMGECGTNPVAGVGISPSREPICGVPVFNLVEEAMAECGSLTTSLIFNHPYEVLDAASEALAAGIKQIILIRDCLPPLDLLQLDRQAQREGAIILGPGDGGIIVPGQICLGAINPQFYQWGNVAILNRGDSSLSDEVALSLKGANLGESLAVNLGNQDLVASELEFWLEYLTSDSKTSCIILIVSDCHYLNLQAIANYVRRGEPLPLIVYFTDSHQLKSANLAPKSKMITDRVPWFLGQIIAFEEIIKELTRLEVPFTFQSSQLPELIQQHLN